MKVEAVSLLLAACLVVAAALPIESGVGEEGSREERSKKDSAKLRLMEAIANSRSNTPNGKEKQSTIAQPVKEETKITVTKSESTATIPKAASPKSEESTTAKLERQRSIADQALRERLRQPSKAKDQSSAATATSAAALTNVAWSAEKAQQETPQLNEAAEVPPVVYVPMSSSQWGDSPLRYAPYVPAVRPQKFAAVPALSPFRRVRWPFSNYFPIIINDPFVTLTGGTGSLFEYGPEADVCKPNRDNSRLEPDETEVSLDAGGYHSTMIVRGGSVAIAGPGGIATAGRGGTAIVGPGGVAYTKPGGLAVVGPGGKVISRKGGEEVEEGLVQGRSDLLKGGTLVARGPIVYYDNSEDEK